MYIRMNYLNEEKGEMEEVWVTGYFGDSCYTSTDYVECHDDDKGWYALPIKKLYVNKNTVEDVMRICDEVRQTQETLGSILNKVVNKGE